MMMNFVVYMEWPLCVASVVVYMCIWMPLHQVKNITLILLKRVKVVTENEEAEELEPYLSMHVLEDGEDGGEMCSICLVEFDKREVVSRLSRCGHVFHQECIDRWIDCNHFTCPLCRTFLLTGHTLSC